ncbi:COG1470 family protein [Sphingobacterium lumbrici]|uniref:COG1470 family protein n=1 Tax=Sphingobacterium lumbrici TaxID=2559600 RepID=UPI00112DBA17|nr:NEW3 domain-containing protein [Sphingobacterium lumbrici]
MLTRLQFNHAQQFSFYALFLALFFGYNYQAHAQQSATQSNAKSAFETPLINIEAASNEPFRYNATLRNGGGEAVLYDLDTQLPAGWQISYRVQGSFVKSIRLEAGQMQDVSIEVNAAYTAKPDKYKIPVRAVSKQDTLSLDLEAVVKGSYSIEMTTLTGRLSDEVVAGSSKEIQVILKNTGTLPLNDVELSSQLPAKWEATFEPANIKQLESGKTVDVKINLKVPDKTIAGDYVAKFTARNPNGSAEISFRAAVTTSMLSGWIGVLIILTAICLVYYLIRKYGRR